MIRHIAMREFLGNMTNLRFIVGLLLCIVLGVSSVLILVNHYRDEVSDYQVKVSLQNEFLGNYAHTNRLGGLGKPPQPPNPFRPLVASSGGGDVRKTFNENPLPALFPYVDFIFIVSVVMSLLAVLFSYDSIAGEREKGTLKLMGANSVSRAAVLFGKWIGGFAGLLVPFVLSLTICVIIVLFQPDIHWSGTIWLSFCLFMLASISYIALFYMLGMMVSTYVRRSTAAILTALFIWAILILVIPNISPFLAAQIYQIPSATKVEREINRIEGIERDELGLALEADVKDKFEAAYGELFSDYMALNSKEKNTRLGENQDMMAMHEKYTAEIGAAWDEANRSQREKTKKIRQNFDNRRLIQMSLAKNIACLSPYSAFLYVATDLTGSGLSDRGYFNKIANDYRRTFNEYVEKRVEETKKENPTFDSNTFLDISGRPRFEYREQPILSRLASLPYWGLLLFFNVLLFVMAYVKMIRYDVR